MAYTVFFTEDFKREFKGLSEGDRTRVKSIASQLKDNPHAGDLLRYRVLREKRLREKRLYYLVFDDLKAVLVVTISDKKAQQKTIDEIARYINEYREYAKRLLSLGGSQAR